MSKVIIRPSGESVEINKDQTLLECLRENNIYIKSTCGGVASCSDCIVKIVSGEDNISSPPFDELQLLGNVFHITKERMACQCRVLEGDITIDISAHDKNKDQQRLRNKTTSFSAKTRVRKKDDVATMYEERAAKVEEKKANRPPANEKEGGLRRPKTIKTQNDN